MLDMLSQYNGYPSPPRSRHAPLFGFFKHKAVFRSHTATPELLRFLGDSPLGLDTDARTTNARDWLTCVNDVNLTQLLDISKLIIIFLKIRVPIIGIEEKNCSQWKLSRARAFVERGRRGYTRPLLKVVAKR
jgi:hypothetical protein